LRISSKSDGLAEGAKETDACVVVEVFHIDVVPEAVLMAELDPTNKPPILLGVGVGGNGMLSGRTGSIEKTQESVSVGTGKYLKFVGSCKGMVDWRSKVSSGSVRWKSRDLLSVTMLSALGIHCEYRQYRCWSW